VKNLETNLAKINATILELTGKDLYSPEQKVQLIAMSKYASDEQIKEAYDFGLRCFGENYVIPALQRQESLKVYFKEPVQWHLTGTLQKNKVSKAVGHFDLIQSVDSLELAEKISQRAGQLNIVQSILLQVNLSGEISKGGFSRGVLEDNFDALMRLPNIKICGLMTMAAKDGRNTETIFKEMSQMRSTFASLYTLDSFHLSMGMSNDYGLAVQNGTTMIRIGRALFD
jgi:pyridoxal phosphate enzyme (YggS family)